MPSEYTDEIENPSYTWRAFSMGRKSKYSAEEKLLILNEVLRNGIHKVIVNTDLKLSEITGLKMYFFTGLNAVLYVVPCNLSCDMIYQKF